MMKIPLWFLLVVILVVSTVWIWRRLSKIINPTPKAKNDLEDYNKERAKLLTGDVIAFRGTDFFAKIIQFFTKTHISHVGTLIRFGGFEEGYRNYILEAVTDKGVSLIPLSRKLKLYKGKAWHYPIKLDQINDDKRNKMFEYLMRELGKGYDFKNIVDMTARILKQIDNIKFGMTPEDSNQMICSELSAFAFKHVGLLRADANPSTFKPVDIVNQPFLDQSVTIL